jgi:hypothetical protein
VEAEVVALKGGGHLDASVADNPVKVVFVALVTAAQASLEPEAGLHCAIPDEMVTLPG